MQTLRKLLFLAACSSAVTAFAQADHFVTTWQTNNTLPVGSSGPTTIIIPTTGAGYDYDVDWDNDGVFDEFGITGNATHDYGVAGTYTVRITGDFPRIYFNNTGDRWKLVAIEQWGTNPWTSMRRAFAGVRNPVMNATDLPDLSNVTDMHGMFFECHEFNSDISAWDVSNVTDMSRLFDRAYAFDQDLSAWDVSNVTNMSMLFKEAAAYDQPLSAWDVSSVTDMTYLFENADSFDQSLDAWDVSNVTTMHHMFWNADAFNSAIGNWDVSNVTSMWQMFTGATSFNQPIASWEVSQVSDLTNMFSGATAYDQPLNSWNLGTVNLWGMFAEASSFDQPLDNWDVSGATFVNHLFSGATAFDQDLGTWDMSNITSTANMFTNASSFDQDLSVWDLANVTNMSNMFRGATAYDRDLSAWDISNVTTMEGMFNGTGLSQVNYDQTLMGWAAQAVQDDVPFDAGDSRYCDGAAARNTLTDDHGWIITDGGLDCTVGLQELDAVERSLYPNPTTDLLYIDPAVKRGYQVMDATGRVVLRGSLGTGVVDVGALAPGTYHLGIEGEKPLRFVRR